ncbi:RNA-directed DNA polymerase, eukaryota, reverse transcriptase zinc-binding domain protein [Tanacetum coccineum]
MVGLILNLFPMNLKDFAWNVRGLNNDLSQKQAIDMIRNGGFSFCALLETKLKKMKRSRICSKVLGRWDWCSNASSCVGGTGIIVGWNPNAVRIMVHSQTAQEYLMRSLWKDLFVHSHVVKDAPWVLLGDFNVILDPSERSFGFSGITSGMEEFRSCISKIEVSDLFVCSDHALSVLSIPNDSGPKPNPFKFANFLSSKAEFMPIVKGVWDMKVSGFAMFSLASKLKLLKKPLRKLKFAQGYLATKVHEVKGRLCAMQEDMDEELFLKQRSKITWLSEGDFNTKFFHNSLKERTNKGRVEYVEDLDGHGYFGDDVKDQFVKHFENVLGKREEVDPIYVPSSLFKNKLSLADTEMMVRRVSLKEIKEVLFSMNDDKAPGPDGYSAKFFKAAWSIVGMEFSQAIMDFLTNDDLMNFSHGDVKSIRVIKTALEEFTRFFGLKPSMEKSLVFFSNVSDQDVPLLNDVCWGWRKILLYRGLIREYIVTRIGIGKDTYVWFDNWSLLGPLCQFISKRDIFEAGLSLSCKVSDVDRSDKVLWKSNNNKVMPFSVSTVWSDLSISLPSVPWYKVVWFSQYIPRNAFILWLAINKKLNTQDRVIVWNKVDTIKCFLCNSIMDNHDHLFFGFEYSLKIWRPFKNLMMCNDAPDNFFVFIDYISSRPLGKSIWSIIQSSKGHCSLVIHSWKANGAVWMCIFLKGWRSTQFSELQDVKKTGIGFISSPMVIGDYTITSKKNKHKVVDMVENKDDNGIDSDGESRNDEDSCNEDNGGIGDQGNKHVVDSIVNNEKDDFMDYIAHQVRVEGAISNDSYVKIVSNGNDELSKELIYIPTRINENGDEVVIFEEELVKEGSKKWQLTICGHFVGCNMPLGELKYNLRRMWGRHGLFEIIADGSDMRIFKFNNAEGMNYVIDQSPWMVNGKPFVVQKWDLDSLRRISALASRLGKPIVMDSITASMCHNGSGRAGYAKILVEIDAKKGIQDLIKVVDKTCRHQVKDDAERMKGKEQLINEVVGNNGRNNVFTEVRRRPNFPKHNGGLIKKSANKYAVLATEEEGKENIYCDDRIKVDWNDDESDEENEVLEVNDPAIENLIAEKIQGIWNIRGISNELKQKDVVSMLRDEKLQIMMGWNTNMIRTMVIIMSNQSVLCYVETILTKVKFFCSIIYASNNGIERRSLWKDLEGHKCFVRQHPWVLIGDFNVTLNVEEHSAGMSHRNIDMQEFHDAVNNLKIKDICSSGFQYTWTKSLKNPNCLTLKKLDRIMVNDEFMNPAELIIQKGYIKKNNAFKFSNFTIGKGDFIDNVQNVWKQDVHGCHMYRLIKKMKNLKKPLKALSWSQVNVYDRVRALKEELNTRHKDVDKNPFDLKVKAIAAQTLNEYIEASKDELSLLQQKAKIQWLKEGDKNTAFFHNMIKARRNKSRVQSIKDEYGKMYEGSNVAEQFVLHFKKFLGESIPVKSIEENLFINKINDEDVVKMTEEVSNDEIKNAIFDINSNKASGPDGFSSGFFKKAWEVIGNDFCLVMKEFFRSGKILEEINASLIALIPKINTPSKVSDFRPTACCNVIYKRISKILTNKIKQDLSKIVNINQSAFIPGRHIQDNILIAQELLRGYNRKNRPKRCAMQIDIQKAYDTVNWTFLESILEKFGFPKKMVK